MENRELLEQLFDKKILKIITFLINDNSEEGLYLREISKSAKVSSATTFRIVQKLIRLGFVNQIKLKKSKFYKAVRNEKTELLYKLFKKDIQVINIFLGMVKDMPELQTVILHGREANDRANVLLIGMDVNTDKIKEICGAIKEKYNFMISPLALTPEQYEQMSRMGLYSGQKKILFRR